MDANPQNSIWDTPKKFDTFLVITPTGKDVTFKEYSPMKIGSELRKICTKKQTKSVQKSGKSIIVEVQCPEDSSSLLKTNSFLEKPVGVTPHRRLNTSRGVIKHWEFKNTEPEEWKDVPGVLEARQIKKRGKDEKTPLWILTFDQPTPPVSLQVEYVRLAVRPYVRKPLRCFNCQKFGHQGKYCKGKKTCVNCGKAEEHVDCTADAWCPNCKESGHSAASKDCSKFQQEELILKTMAEHGGSYIHVRDTLFPRQARPSYAQAASLRKTTPKKTNPQQEKVTQAKIFTQTDSLSDKNRKRTHPMGQSPEGNRHVKIEKLTTHNRFTPLQNLNGTDPFKFTGMAEAVDTTPLEASNTPANSKNLQGGPPPQPSPTPDPDSVEMSPLQDDPPDPDPDSIEDHPPPPPPPPPPPIPCHLTPLPTSPRPPNHDKAKDPPKNKNTGTKPCPKSKKPFYKPLE